MGVFFYQKLNKMQEIKIWIPDAETDDDKMSFMMLPLLEEVCNEDN